MTKARMVDLDVGRGFMMIFVVFSHVYNREFPQGNDWYRLLYDVRDWFNMPFFMFLTGIVMAHGRTPRSFQEYRSYFAKRFMRLVPAYVFFATVIFMGKMATQDLGNVGLGISSLADYIRIYTAPKTSTFASYLWFIYILFFYSIAFPFLKAAMDRQAALCVAAAVVLHFLPFPEFMALNLFFNYLVFLVAGVAVVSYYPRYLHVVDTWRWGLWGLFLAVCVTAVHVAIPSLFISLVSLPALHALSRTPLFEGSTLLSVFARYMFPIYLMNTIPINIARGVILRFVSWDGPMFLLICPALMAVGLAVPVMVQKYVIARTPVLRRIVY